MAGGFALGGHEAQDLVEVDQRPQGVGAGLAAHPGDQLGQHQGDDELPLVVRQVGERDDGAGRLAAGPQDGVEVEVITLAPGREGGGGEQAVELHGQLRAVSGREEVVDLEHAQLADLWRDDLADQARQVEVPTLGPGVVDEVGQQDVLAAGERVGRDADQPEEAGHEALDLVGDGLRVGAFGRPVQAPDDVEAHAGGGARRVDGERGGVLERLDPGAVDAPRGQALLPGARHLGGVTALHPGGEPVGRERREGEEQVPEVALGVEDQGGDAVEERLLDEIDAEAGLTRSGHADDHAVGGEVGRLEEDLLAGAPVVAVDRLADEQPARRDLDHPA